MKSVKNRKEMETGKNRIINLYYMLLCLALIFSFLFIPLISPVPSMAASVSVLNQDGVPQGITRDDDTKAVVFIDQEHYQLHKGKAFVGSFSNTTAATNGHRSAIYFKTPAEGEIHIIEIRSASTAANFVLLEGVSIDAGEGTNGKEAINRKRYSTNLSGIIDNAGAVNKYTTFTETQLAAANMTFTTTLRDIPLVVGAGPKPDGGDSRSSQEFILKKDTGYIFELKNTAASANKHYIEIDWYEIEDH